MGEDCETRGKSKAKDRPVAGGSGLEGSVSTRVKSRGFSGCGCPIFLPFRRTEKSSFIGEAMPANTRGGWPRRYNI